MTTRVIQFVFDDLSALDFGCTGNPDADTPAIDAIAAAGMRYTRFRSNFAVCSPSRATMITGQSAAYAWINAPDTPETGARQWLPSGATTIQRCLKKMLSPAPHTRHYGKWHLGTPGEGRNTMSPNGFGIDYFFGAVNGPSSAIDAFESYENAWVLENDVYVPTTGWVTNVYTDNLLAWLDAHGNDPAGFLITFWHHIPHATLDPDVPEAALFPGLTGALKTYVANLKHADNDIARVVAKLQSLGIYSDTHIFITSDNGPPGGSASYQGDLSGSKNSAYDGGLLVPLIWKGPGVPVAVDNQHRLGIDWFPTVADLFGIETPGWPGVHLLDSVPNRSQGFVENNSSAWLQPIGDGRMIKLLRDGVGDSFYCVDTDAGEKVANKLVQVPSGAVAGQINTSDVTALTASFNAFLAAYPTAPGETFVGYNGLTETQVRDRVEAELAEEPRLQDFLVHMCGTTGSALQNALESLADHPYTVSCGHGAGDITEASLGTLRTGTHAFGASTIVSGFLWDLCYNEARLVAKCTSLERAEIRARLATTSSNRMLND